jgi:hypothetical protein
MRRFFITVSLLIATVSSVVVAQPGYQGKKNLIKYSGLISPAWSNATYGATAKLLNFNLTHNLSLSRVLSRRTMLGIKGSYARTSIPYTLNYQGHDLYSGDVSPIKAYSYSVGIEYYIFKSKPGNLAPLGGYIMTECNVMWVSLYDSEYKQSLGGFNKINAGVWLGQQKIYFNKLVLDVAIGTQLVLISTGAVANFSDTNGATLKENTESRLFKRNLFNLKIGVGYLF